jgi:hypothetical protein
MNPAPAKPRIIIALGGRLGEGRGDRSALYYSEQDNPIQRNKLVKLNVGVAG